MVTKICQHCNCTFERKSYIAKLRNFCSAQCSSASRMKLREPKEKRKGVLDCTLSEVTRDKKGASRYTAVRSNARLLYKDLKVCEFCGYDKHVEVCHKKPIHGFSPETKICEINARENILILCPNCHWEFDHPI